MARLLKKYTDVFVVLFFAVAVFASRLVNLTLVPIFTDEAIYVRWAQIGLADPAHRYISLTDGKQPLMIWAMYPFLKLFEDPLFAGRFVSVLSGVTAVVGIYLLSKFVFGRSVAILASVIYLLSPFTLIYDKLALMDSLLAALGVWSLYLAVLQVKYIRLDLALLLGLTVGLGLMTKSSAMFFLYFLPFTLLYFDFTKKTWMRDLVRWILFSLLSVLIALVMYNSLRLSPFFYIIEQKNFSFVMTFSDFLADPFRLFLPNLNGLYTFIRDYLTLPVLILILISLISAVLSFRKSVLLMFIWFAFPFMSLAAFGKVLFPRFVLFMVYPLFIITADILYRLLRKGSGNMLYYLLFAGLLVLPVYNSLVITVNPLYASIPEIDRNQLFDDWPSGYGAGEVIKFIAEKAGEGKVVIGTEGTFGLNPAVYEIYLKGNENVTILGYWPVNEVPGELLEYAKTYPTYLVFKDRQEFPPDWPITLVNKYRRGLGNTYLYFYQVNPPDVE